MFHDFSWDFWGSLDRFGIFVSFFRGLSGFGTGLEWHLFMVLSGFSERDFTAVPTNCMDTTCSGDLVWFISSMKSSIVRILPALNH